MKLTQRLDLIVLVLLFLFLLTGCTTAEVLDTLSKINQDTATISPNGCTEDEILWCEGHNRANTECMCVDREVMQSRLQNQMQTITIW